MPTQVRLYASNGASTADADAVPAVSSWTSTASTAKAASAAAAAVAEENTDGAKSQHKQITIALPAAAASAAATAGYVDGTNATSDGSAKGTEAPKKHATRRATLHAAAALLASFNPNPTPTKTTMEFRGKSCSNSCSKEVEEPPDAEAVAAASLLAETMPPRHDWEFYYSQLKKYKEKHCSANVPPGHLLYTWIAQQKANYEFLSTKEIGLLQKLGVVFQQLLSNNPCTAKRYLDLSCNPPEWRLINENASTGNDPKAISHGSSASANNASIRNEPKEWEVNIMEKNRDRPWWKGIASKKPEPTRPARLLNKTPEKTDEKKVDFLVEISSPKAFTDTQRAEARSKREERAERRRARFGELPDAPPKKKKRFSQPQTAAATANGEDESKTPIDVQKNSQQNDAREDQSTTEDDGLSTPPAATPKSAPKKANCTDSGTQLLSFNQPCTIMGGNLTSGFITLTLPPLPLKLGIFLEFNPIFGYVEVKNVSNTSPLAIQIPVNFRKDCFITSIDTESLGCIVPISIGHCGDIFNLARSEKSAMEEVRVVVNFAKNPMSLFIPKEDPCHSVISILTEERKLCNGRSCGMKKTKECYSTYQWSKSNYPRFCMDCCMQCTRMNDKSNKKALAKGPQNAPPRNTSQISTFISLQSLCRGCKMTKTSKDFSAGEWYKNMPGQRTCLECIKVSPKKNSAVSISQKANTSYKPPLVPQIPTHPEPKQCSDNLPAQCASSVPQKALAKDPQNAPPRNTSQVSTSVSLQTPCRGCKMTKNSKDFPAGEWNKNLPGMRTCLECIKVSPKKNSATFVSLQKLCRGCKMKKALKDFSAVEWNKDLLGHRTCLECIKVSPKKYSAVSITHEQIRQAQKWFYHNPKSAHCKKQKE